MQLYLIAPRLADNSDDAAADARLRMCVQSIADLILHHLSGDPALFGMRHIGESSDAIFKPETRYGYADVLRIADSGMLREILVACGDRHSSKWMLIRSLVTCRAVFYGYDGQAFVCLPSEAAPIVSPDDRLIMVEECSHMLVETDWLDGLQAD
jgi:hypothetical protein